jgi:hypothetical protein
MNRDDLYPSGYPKRGCVIGRPRPQPKPRNPRTGEYIGQALCVLLVLGILVGIFLAGRG